MFVFAYLISAVIKSEVRLAATHDALSFGDCTAWQKTAPTMPCKWDPPVRPFVLPFSSHTRGGGVLLELGIKLFLADSQKGLLWHASFIAAGFGENFLQALLSLFFSLLGRFPAIYKRLAIQVQKWVYHIISQLVRRGGS